MLSKKRRVRCQVLAGIGAVLILIVSTKAVQWYNSLSGPVLAVQCIVGEAEGEPFAGKLAVAHALINRGTAMGVYGCRSKRVKKKLFPAWAWADAQRAWALAKKTHKDFDPVFGAANWLSVNDPWAKASWVGFCDAKVKIGNHVFFKCP